MKRKGRDSGTLKLEESDDDEQTDDESANDESPKVS